MCTELLVEAGTKLARGRVPLEILPAIRLGRLTALQKSDGGIRGIVVGDVFRRLVARTLAQQFGPQVECATHPFQYALSNRASTECVAHMVRSRGWTMKPRFLSVDGVGAHDTISRIAIFQGLADMVDGDKFLSSASSTTAHPHFCGKMSWGRPGKWFRVKVQPWAAQGSGGGPSTVEGRRKVIPFP